MGLTVQQGSETLCLLPEKALWLPGHRCLLVADAHVGKATSFRRRGVPVPEATTADTLARLDALLHRLSARRLVFLGDLLHSRDAHAPAPLQALMAWRQRHPSLELTLVRGNHDHRAGDPPHALGVHIVDEPWALGGLALCHHPQAVAGALAVAGHLHPCVAVGRGVDRLRLPCFHLAQGTLVLPAFGAFTGMHPVQPLAGDRVFAVADGVVLEVGTIAAPPAPRSSR